MIFDDFDLVAKVMSSCANDLSNPKFSIISHRGSRNYKEITNIVVFAIEINISVWLSH